ncbi:MAG TPA: STAS domain-containing protein [Actinomycetota bacterium]|nr:STAS domain-containing protein [Actinomycetota bacterium]
MATPCESPTKCLRVIRAPDEPNTTILVFNGRIEHEEIPLICEWAGPLLAGGDAGLVVCDVRDVIDPDVVTLDALARLQLTAKRMGHKVVIRHASHQLNDLLDFTGLRDVVSAED